MTPQTSTSSVAEPDTRRSVHLTRAEVRELAQDVIRVLEEARHRRSPIYGYSLPECCHTAAQLEDAEQAVTDLLEQRLEAWQGA